MLSRNPAFVISETFSSPEPNTTALGGVATGNIKAQDAAMVAGIISRKGCTSIVIAIGAKIGSNMAVVAKFDVISVKKLILNVSTGMSKMIGRLSRRINLDPIHSASPVLENPAAKAIPPPKRINTPHGVLTASAQFNIAPFFSVDGIINRDIPATIAMIVSSNKGMKFCSHCLDINKVAVREKQWKRLLHLSSSSQV